jgi:hypothetical protein
MKKVNCEKRKYMVMSSPNAGQSDNKIIGNEAFESVELFRHFVRTVTIEDPIHEEIKCRLKSWNA